MYSGGCSWLLAISYLMSPYPTVVMVTTAHQNASGMDLKNDWSEPASAKYTVLENSTTPGKQHAQRQCRPLKTTKKQKTNKNTLLPTKKIKQHKIKSQTINCITRVRWLLLWPLLPLPLRWWYCTGNVEFDQIFECAVILDTFDE